LDKQRKNKNKFASFENLEKFPIFARFEDFSKFEKKDKFKNSTSIYAHERVKIGQYFGKV